MPRAPLCALIIGLCLGCGTKKDAEPTEADAKATELDAAPPTKYQLQHEGWFDLDLRPSPEIAAGEGWVSELYAAQFAVSTARVYAAKPEARKWAALAYLTEMGAPRLPSSLSTAIAKLPTTKDGGLWFGQLMASNRELLESTCGQPIDVFTKVVALEPKARTAALFDECDLGRFGLVRREHASELTVLAAMAYVELDRQGGITPGELILLKEIAWSDPAAFAPYPQLRRRLAKRERPTLPSPQEWEPMTPPPGVQSIEYPSGELKLGAWLSVPKDAKSPAPALVYFHGGFAFGEGDYEVTQPFRDAGFVVMVPTVRGENGNPGAFEMYLGEVDDAVAAVEWLAARPEVDPQRVYAFGHSAGGILSAMLSVVPDLPLVHSGSAGGLYLESLFVDFAEMAPFDPLDRYETSARILFGHTDEMQRTHYAWLATEAPEAFQIGIGMLTPDPTKLHIAVVENADHNSQLEPAIAAYLQCTQFATRCPLRRPLEAAPED